ncbi:hypothetical protein [Gemmatimonas sp.]|uniref:hypothetical protein n=1 Tax=Gemmatimonas sp. TaxID=1962908 RepID=UPI00286E27F3|nr:hypothetical protein [Gemmatimonas sp.]
MSTKSFHARLFASVLALCVISSAGNAQLSAAGRARLDSLRQTPEMAGTLIYQGTVFALRGPGADTLFRYERRVHTTASGISVTHATRDPAGTLIIDESAQLSASYDFQRFDAANAQAGISGSVVSSRGGRHLEYTLNDNGRVSTATEDVQDPVVTGPSVHGFIRQHWNELATGSKIRVRMVVLNRKTSYGFDLRMKSQADGQTTFSSTESSALVRLVIKPLNVTFVNSDRSLVRYEGRVPPMQKVGGKLKDLDARVEYRMVTAYR